MQRAEDAFGAPRPRQTPPSSKDLRSYPPLTCHVTKKKRDRHMTKVSDPNL